MEADPLRLMLTNRGWPLVTLVYFKGHKMNKHRETEIAKAVGHYLFDAGGKASIAQIRRNLPYYITLTEADRVPSTTRPGEEMWEQQVRNIVCHRDVFGNAVNMGQLKYSSRHLALTNGPQGDLGL
jgi:hypothetical protein